MSTCVVMGTDERSCRFLILYLRLLRVLVTREGDRRSGTKGDVFRCIRRECRHHDENDNTETSKSSFFNYRNLWICCGFLEKTASTPQVAAWGRGCRDCNSLESLSIYPLPKYPDIPRTTVYSNNILFDNEGLRFESGLTTDWCQQVHC